MEKELENYLLKFDVKYKVHMHKAVFTVAESKNDLDIQKIPGLRTKSLFIKDENNQFYLICMPGEKRLNIKLLEKNLKVKHLKFCSPEELKSELRLTPGSVSIFGMIHSKNIILIVDEEVWNAEIADFHPNINTSTLEITHEDLEKFINSLNCKKLILNL